MPSLNNKGHLCYLAVLYSKYEINTQDVA